MQVVPFDAGAPVFGHARVAYGVVRRPLRSGSGRCDESFGPRVAYSHVAQPLACSSLVFQGHAVVDEEHALDRGVQAALEPVGRARHRPARSSEGSR